MSIVTLVSGGLDSSLIAVLTAEEGLKQFPLFIDYGHRARDRELAAYYSVASRYGLPDVRVVSIPGYGQLIPSGLTDPSLHLIDDAFLPGRNLVFLVIAAAYATHVDANAVAIGLLDEAFSIFPDQTRSFIHQTEKAVSAALGRSISVLTPLMTLTKAQVVAMAQKYGIEDTYSCHLGDELPCGDCIGCNEYTAMEV